MHIFFSFKAAVMNVLWKCRIEDGGSGVCVFAGGEKGKTHPPFKMKYSLTSEDPIYFQFSK